MKISFNVDKAFSCKRIFTNIVNGGIEIEEESQDFNEGDTIDNVSEYSISRDKKLVNLKLEDYSTLTNVPTSSIQADKLIDESGNCSECEKKRKARS